MQYTHFVVIGTGQVGETLANGLLEIGHQVIRVSRTPEKLTSWLTANKHYGKRAAIKPFSETCNLADHVVLAVKGSAAEEVISYFGPKQLAGKIVLDPTNPIADAPPEQGILSFFTSHNQSLMERLQLQAPNAFFVKVFSCVGANMMVHPKDLPSKPTMFGCGNHMPAKDFVQSVVEAFGWQWMDMGGAIAARAIEPLCLLWCARGFQTNRWHHAFALLE